MWSQETQDLADHTLTKYERPVEISPYSFFNLNRAGFLSTLALVFTYLIVLVQFRTSEE